MIKPASLRHALTDALPELRRDPDKLLVFIDKGQVIATQAKSLSFEFRYQLNVILLDYADSVDPVIVAVLAWAKQHQPTLLSYPHGKPLSFEVDHLNHSSADIALTLELTEGVIATQTQEGSTCIEHVEEALPPWEEW